MRNAPTDPLPIAQALIRCPSVTPIEGGALGVLEDALKPLGFACTQAPPGDGRWTAETWNACCI